MTSKRPKQILLVTGMSGAGKSTVLRTLEDLGWETVDNLPLLLLNRLLDTAPGDADDDRPLAIGIGTQTRGFDPENIVRRIKKLREDHGHDVGTLFLECSGAELERRYSETRRRHPMAQDRPAQDGIAHERELLTPLRSWANRLIDTTDLSANELAQQIRTTFSGAGQGDTVISVVSFGFARGLPRDADLVFDMRFLRNPHWDPELRPGTGKDPEVAAYIAADPAYPAAMAQ
ncbi:MAG: RNase adaptor protein RapZ, partial [Methyloversatilis sp.]|nr:RNase adaptor protein RapZ [Methyloversatilis sp.]